MSGNTIGHLFRLTTFGESHGKAIGGVIDGCPAGLSVDTDFIQAQLDRRKPLYPGSTPRKESDVAEFLSGIHEGLTLGTPIGFIIRNLDAKSTEYQKISGFYRPSHADFTYFQKYRTNAPGGGRASGRETVTRVVGGAVASQFLKHSGIEINACVSQVGHVIFEDDLTDAGLSFAAQSAYGCPDKKMEDRVASLIRTTEQEGDTLGGIITCRINSVPAGLGEPVFDKLQADLAKAMLSIGSAKAFGYGLGFRASSMKGSEYNDQLTGVDGKVIFLSNHDGGIQGGISNGEAIYFRVGFKPVPSIKKTQSSVNQNGEPAEIKISGRHDTCHVPRLVVVVESMAALVMADHLLRNAGSRMA